MVEIGVNGVVVVVVVVDRAAPAILFPKLLIAAMVAKMMMSSLGQLQFHPIPGRGAVNNETPNDGERVDE